MDPTSAKQLNYRNIALVDQGKVEMAMNHAIKSAIRDVIDRPADKGKRTASLKITMTPELDEDTAVLDTIGFQFAIALTVPTRRNAAPYPMLPHADGTVTFQPASPKDPRQQNMFVEDEAGSLQPASDDEDQNVSDL
jgi:hypothetical protein